MRILLVDDEPAILKLIKAMLSFDGHDVSTCSSGEDALEHLGNNEADIMFSDLVMQGISGTELITRVKVLHPHILTVIISGHGIMKDVIEALRSGAFDFLIKPVMRKHILSVIAKAEPIVNAHKEERRLRRVIGSLQSSNDTTDLKEIIIGASSETAQLREQVSMAASSGCSSVLVTGKTGTGKEVVSRAIHSGSHAPSDPFIALNCPALPENLVESELFGHVKGAFTGAHEDRTGAFELADGGSLFLDEISDLSATAQAKLLRVLEMRVVRPVGAEKERPVNVRVIAATNHDLQQRVNEGKFRADLLFRLNVFHIHILPLYQRTDDIIPLAEHFLNRIGQASHYNICHGFSEDAKQTLLEYDYPGNARELCNIIERATILCDQEFITREHLLVSLKPVRKELNVAEKIEGLPEEAERIYHALVENHWHRKKAASALGMSYDAIRWRIRKYQLAED